MRMVVTGMLALALAGCNSTNKAAAPDPSPSPAAAPAPAAAVAVADAVADAAPADFAQCKSCHAVAAGQNGVGPSLAGVFGRKAGLAPGYAYSDVVKGLGLTWDEANLDRWLENPMKMAPGTKMGFGGLADKARRQAMIAYLKTLK